MDAKKGIDAERYLTRIGLSESPSIDRAGLAMLQRSHMAAVPFENLDVVAGVEVRTDLEWSCLLYTSPSPRDRTRSRMPSSA